MTLRIGRTSVSARLGRGEHTLVWSAKKAAPGVYHPRLVAVGGYSGKTTQEMLPPLTVAHAPGPPPLAVKVAAPAVLSWSSTAPGTPWLHLELRLSQGGATKTIDLGKRKLAGTRHLHLPSGRWHATLFAKNSAGRSRSVSLGYLPR